MRWLDSITDGRDMNLSELWEMVKDSGWIDGGACHAPVPGVAKSQT